MRVLIPAMLVAGCTPTDASDPPTPEEDVVPTEGDWEDELVAIPDDGCNLLSNGYVLGDIFTFSIRTLDEGFEIEIPPVVRPCTVDGSSFACEENVVEQTQGTTTLTETWNYTGTFTDADFATQDAVLVSDCEGPLCATAEADLGTTFPCTSGLETTWTRI